MDIFDENEFIDEKPKVSSSEPKHMKLRRVLSSTFLDTLNFSSAEEYKDKDQIKDDSFSLKHMRRRSSANEIDDKDTVINPIFGFPLDMSGEGIYRSDGLLPSPRASNSIKLTDSAPVRADSAEIKSKKSNRFRRLARSRKGEKKGIGTEESRSLEEENELLRSKLDSLRRQVQMLAERNADLRLQNHSLKTRNENLTKRSKDTIRQVTRQISSPNNLS